MKRKIANGTTKGARIGFANGRGTFNGESRLLLFINDELVTAPATNVKLLAYLHEHLGQVVPMDRLCLQLGFPNVTEANRHILRQYMAWIRQMLDPHGYRVTVDRNFGYALCETAQCEFFAISKEMRRSGRVRAR
jgi:DNA-binding winged helix-turn-helix (wHTH) protein